MTPDQDDFEPHHASSPTDQVLHELQLYGFRPFQDEPDPRPLPEAQILAGSVADIFDALFVALSDTRLEPDLADLLWSTVNVFHRAVGKIERELDDNEVAQQRSQREQDGSEVKSVELERLTAEGQTLIERRNAFELMRDEAADQFERHTHASWRPRNGSKVKRTTPILYEAGGVQVEVFAVPEHGMATIWDADVLIWAASQIVEAENLGFKTSRFLRFTPYQLLVAIGRETGSRDYKLLKGALTRLQSTVIRTTIRQGEQWRRHQFSWINEWAECTTLDGRVEGMEFVLPDWFYRGIIDRSLVLTIDPAYFRLTGGIERWLYRVARKHAGRQKQGWVFDIPHLHQKSGSLAKVTDFAFDIRRIALRQPLPGYRLRIEREGKREMLRILPANLSTEPVESRVDALGTSGVTGHGTSGVTLSGFRAPSGQLSLWPETTIPLCNLESNLYQRR